MYTVIGMDGREYGPVDVGTLLQWANEKRVLPGTTVRDMTTGQVLTAGQIPDLQMVFNRPPGLQTMIGASSGSVAPYGASAAPSSVNGTRIAAGICGILFGGLGIHKFIIGQAGAGAIMLAVALVGGLLTFGLAALAMGIVGFVEGIIYLTKSDADFYREYIIGKKAWF
ncbi:MAG: TM2 domain-containing protein [Chthonomonadales bacterium]